MHLAENDENVETVTFEEFKEVLISDKNRKSLGDNNINLKLYKYASEKFLIRLHDFINLCWKTGHVPDLGENAATTTVIVE